jgi:hypothetical protein
MIKLDMKSVFAASPTPTDIKITITEPQQGGIPGATSLGTILNNAITIIFAVATLLVLFMLILGAFSWITSAGDKEKVAGARNRILHALVGLAILALAFVILTVVSQILQINLLNLTLPSLGQPH